MTQDIHDLFRAVREHPDFVFGTIFVTGDFSSPEAAERVRNEWAKYWDDRLVQMGNELVEDLEEGLVDGRYKR